MAYRDRGDEYVTKTFDLTNDIDAVYGQLRSFQAAGGGDEPESVNEALAGCRPEDVLERRTGRC